MRRSGLLVACALLLVTNAVVLTGVALNRRGEPEARLTLTEREIRFGYQEKENTGLWLSLQTTYAEPWSSDGPSWFNDKKLREIGFDCSVPPADPGAELHYEKALPRSAFAVLEFDGDSWKAWIARREQELLHPPPDADQSETLAKRRKQLEEERVEHSRLFVIDVGRDASALRARYPDRSRHAVVGAITRLRLDRTWDEEAKTWKTPHLAGYVSEILCTEIHVPLDKRRVLDDIRVARAREAGRPERQDFEGYSPYHQGPPGFRVTLNYGRRFEPWIDDVQPLAPPGP